MARTATISIDPLPRTGSRALTEDDARLVNLHETSAAWVWLPKPTPDSVDKATLTECAFRNTYATNTARGTPSNVTIVFDTVDFFSLRANGVEVQPYSWRVDWRSIYAYSIPLPVGPENDSSSLVLAFRVTTISHAYTYPGLRAVVQVNYPDSWPPDVFLTGSDPGWLAENALQHQYWEQPWFDPLASGEGNWLPATLNRPVNNPPHVSRMWQREVVEFGRLPAAPNTSNSTCDCPVLDNKGGAVVISHSKLAGALAGSVVAALVLGALGAWLLMRKKLQDARENTSAGVVEPPAPEIHIPHQASSLAPSNQPGNTPSVP
ncbi:hypothetical protein DFP72DRAFT_1067797 [Ephemerocybe angulata]|uniref:Uncharacterized protein n=1 Tax=Ephemerocybe angulata TaxID=980116 RepID=A0A8H6HXI8_9AGAR|nr:hypothetical protein DFP72DRAFT_1067797 [Tulosesus angulatus]